MLLVYPQLAASFGTFVILGSYFPPVTLSSFNCEFTASHLEYHNVTYLKQSLQYQILGPVLTPWDDKYEQFRRIHNQACCQKPLLIARPRGQKVSYLSWKMEVIINITICFGILHRLFDLKYHLNIICNLTNFLGQNYNLAKSDHLLFCD